MFWRSWLRIPTLYTGWTFICCKNCHVCLKRRKETKKSPGMANFLKTSQTATDSICCRPYFRAIALPLISNPCAFVLALRSISLDFDLESVFNTSLAPHPKFEKNLIWKNQTHGNGYTSSCNNNSTKNSFDGREPWSTLWRWEETHDDLKAASSNPSPGY